MSEQEPIKWNELTPEQRDALIAEKVFGWRWVSGPQFAPSVKKDTNWLLPERGLMDIKIALEAAWEDIGSKHFVPRNWIPRYSTSLDAAWLIMDHIKPGRSGETSEEAFLTRVRFVAQLEAMHSWWSWTRERLCEALCLAALRAVGIEVDIKEKS